MDCSTITRAIGDVRPLLAERGCTVSPGVRLRTLAEVVDHLGASGKTGMVVTDGDGVLFCSPTRPGNGADVTHALHSGLLRLLAAGPTMEILADAGYQGLGAQTGGQVVPPPHRKFK